jgi:hypothetical protein
MPRLEESIHFRFWPALARGLWSGFYLTTLLALAILVFFLFINAAFLLQQWLVGPGNPAQRLFALPRTAAFFFGFTWLFVGLVTWPLTLLSAILTRRRTAAVRNGEFIYSTAFSTTAAPLAACTWRIVSMGSDSRGIYFPGHPVVQVTLLNKAVVCGFDPEARQMWSGFFTLAEVPLVRPLGWRRGLCSCLAGCCFGGGIGVGIGSIIHAWTGNPRWITATTLLGLLDGSLIGFLLAALNIGTSEASAWMQQWKKYRALVPVHFALVFAALGMKLGMFAGLAGVVVCSVANGGIGWIAGREFQRRVFDSQSPDIK